MRRRRCGNEEDPKKIQKERETLAPKPLPSTRPRALTCPLQPQPQKPHRSWNIFRNPIPLQKTFDQSQSLLFTRLPPEIRHQIWSHVLGNRLLYIVRAPKALLAIECVEGFGSDLETRPHGCWGFISGPPFDSPLGFYISPRENHPLKPANFLPLLRTCRMIYTEAIPVLYETNIFDFDHLDSLLYFYQSVLPQRLDQIRTLNLSFHIREPLSSAIPSRDINTWRRTCDTLISFQGLEELRVHLSSRYYLQPGTRSKHQWEPLLDALRLVKTPFTFIVYLPWSESQCAEAAQDSGYPFLLMSMLEES
ncbi:hypothetical protein PHISCL_06144 [Aspergillus sclerotialis]|uniref:DUF7730 domain-containing protein n=1 Tax=Aspergillus sclerotialis TaxID=2070753 RepID=A0A3A2ZWU2_9EURO|nr:hypothetical protein PHISCL_06144 [Aspergillus sclerotialis]